MRTSRPFLYDTLLPADSIECLPTSSKDANGTILSLGTYKYDEASKTRSGFLKILKLSTLDSPSLYVAFFVRAALVTLQGTGGGAGGSRCS